MNKRRVLRKILQVGGILVIGFFLMELLIGVCWKAHIDSKIEKHINDMYSENSNTVENALEDLIKIGGYNVGLSMNEETELNKRLAKLGKLLYTPDAIILHNQDRDLKDFSKRMYLFGRGRGENKLFDLQVIPPILIIGAIPLLFLRPIIFLYAVLLYGIILLYFDLNIFLKTKKFQYLFSVPIVFMIEHLSYTAGFWSGVFRHGGKA